MLAVAALQRHIQSHTLSELMFACVVPPLNVVLGNAFAMALQENWYFGAAGARDLATIAASGNRSKFRRFVGLACAVLRGESNDTASLAQIAEG
jgi:hypothetical protein